MTECRRYLSAGWPPVASCTRQAGSASANLTRYFHLDAAHSQGSLILSNAVHTLGLQGVSLMGDPTITTYGAAANRWLMRGPLQAIGLSGIVRGGDKGLDFVGNVIGFNAISNPFRVIGSTLALPTLFSCFSPHSNYP